MPCCSAPTRRARRFARRPTDCPTSSNRRGYCACGQRFLQKQIPREREKSVLGSIKRVCRPRLTNFARIRTESIDEPVHFVRFSTRFSDFRNQNIRVNPSVVLRVSLDSNQAVLFRVVQPVSRPAGPDKPLKLVGLDPNKLSHSIITPNLQAFSSKLHGSSGDPKKNKPVVLQFGNRHLSHLVVRHGSVRELKREKRYQLTRTLTRKEQVGQLKNSFYSQTCECPTAGRP